MPARLEMGVEPDLLRHHGLALGDELGACLAAEREHDVARVRRGGRVMHLAAALDHLALIGLEIEIEMSERMVLDRARLVAQRDRTRATSRRAAARLRMKPRLTFSSARCSWAIGERLLRAFVLKACGARSAMTWATRLSAFAAARPMAGASVMPASTSATWRASMR